MTARHFVIYAKGTKSMTTDNRKLRIALQKLPKLYETDGKRGDLPAVYVFTPDSGATWVLWEYSADEGNAFGLCDLGLGYPEMGYVSVPELEELRGSMGLPVEVDSSVKTRFAGYKRASVEVPSYLEEEK